MCSLKRPGCRPKWQTHHTFLLFYDMPFVACGAIVVVQDITYILAGRRRRRLSHMHRTDKRTVSPGFLCWQESPPDDMVCVFFLSFPTVDDVAFLSRRALLERNTRNTRDQTALG